MTLTWSGERLVERTSRWLDAKVSRRGFLVRSTFAATALAVAPTRYVLEPGSAYNAFCGESQCGNPNCSCGSTCCEGYSTFCCSINNGYNFCPSGTTIGGWWAARDSSYCGYGIRYYLDCNAHCHCTTGCGGGWTFCERGTCDGQACNCAGSNCNNWVTGCYQFRYGQCNNQDACIGAIVCRIVTCTPPYELNINCDNTWMEDDYTAEMNAPCNTSELNPPPPPCDSPLTRCESVAFESDPLGGGYWLATSFGKVLRFGSVGFHGDASGIRLASPIVAMRSTPGGGGYWLTTRNGTVRAYGKAVNHGSSHPRHPNATIVGMAVTPDGGGYWLVGAEGSVFHFGNASFHGSPFGRTGLGRVVGIESSRTGLGYWILGENGAVYGYGDAYPHGAPDSSHPVVGIRRSYPGKGYYVVNDRGAVWAYGDAKDYGQPYGRLAHWNAIGLSLSHDGKGYWVALTDGNIFAFGGAGHHGTAN